MDRVEHSYFSWICQLMDTKEHKSSHYRKLLRYLFDYQFDYILPMDGNRSGDGIELRYRYGYEVEISYAEVAYYLDHRPCSVLEMMAALSLRCEEHILADLNEGVHAGRLFWKMIESLGLIDQTDDTFDVVYTDKVLETFTNREYEPTGEGGLVTLPDCKEDLRQVEIWCQMMWYLNETEN